MAEEVPDRELLSRVIYENDDDIRDAIIVEGKRIAGQTCINGKGRSQRRNTGIESSDHRLCRQVSKCRL